MRYRPAERAPGDRDAAVAAIERAFDAVAGPLQVGLDDAVRFVEGGDDARAPLQAWREGAEHAPVALSDQTVERVRFPEETTADVSLGIWLPGNPQPMLVPVQAVCEDGTWKVSRSTVDHFANLARQFRRLGS